MTRLITRRSAVHTLGAILALTLIPAITGGVARADSGASVPLAVQSGVTDATGGVTESGNLTSASLMASTSVDPSTGILHTSVGIATPPARGAAQPDLSLGYSSEGGPGYAGWGWDLAVPSIERGTYSGPPNYEALPTSPTNWESEHDLFYFEGSRLVPVCFVQNASCVNVPESFPATVNGWWYFRQEVETSFLRFFLSPDQQTWLIQSKDGVTMELGAPLDKTISPTLLPVAAELATAETPHYPFRWHLVRKYDTQLAGGRGLPLNVVNYVWKSELGLTVAAPNERMYLTDVYDTPLAASAGFSYGSFAHHIALTYETPKWGRPTTTNYTPMQRVIPYKRLVGIDVTSARYNDSTAERELVRRYHLVYHEARERSYLDSVQIEGRCSAPIFEYNSTSNPVLPPTSCLKQPATTFTYDAATEAVTWAPRPVAGSFPNKDVSVLDVNTDGLPDLVTAPIKNASEVKLLGMFKADDATTVTSLTGGFSLVTPPGSEGMTAATGNFLSDGHANVLSIATSCKPSTFTTCAPGGLSGISSNVEANTIVPSGTAWAWTALGGADILTQENRNLTCGPEHTDWEWPVVFPEQGYGAGDVDGDGYSDLLTYTVVGNVHCTQVCTHWIGPNPNDPCDDWEFDMIPTSDPFQVAIALRATDRNPDGTFSRFSRLLGDVPMPSKWANLVPATMKYMLVGATDSLKNVHAVPEDINGDGLVDILTASSSGITAAYGSGDGYVHPNGAPYNLVTPNLTISDPNNVYFHDLNGDGLADVVAVSDSGIQVALNRDGIHFNAAVTETIPATVAAWTAAKDAQLMFADMNGSGVDDLVVLQKIGIDVGAPWYADLLGGHRPGLLTAVDNGQGGVTSIQYNSTTDLELQARQQGTPWQRSMGQVLHHVVSIATTNGLTSAPYARATTTTYSYRDPVYDGREQRFVGFGHVRKTNVGAGDDPTQVVDTTYLSGICEVDSGKNCPVAPYDRPFLPLAGKPVLIETSDGAGHYLSTVHNVWNVSIALGADGGKNVRFAYPQEIDTFLYDTTNQVSTLTLQSANDLCITSLESCISVIGGIPVRTGSTQFSQLKRTQQRNAQGNLVSDSDYGVVNVDPLIHIASTWALPSGDRTGWLWRKKTDDIDAFTLSTPFGDVPRHADYNYDAFGNLKTVTATLQGTAGLNRHDAEGRTISTSPPPTASVEWSQIMIASYDYDGWGNRVASHGPRNASCETWTYDTQYESLAIADSVYTQSPQTCSGPAITTSYAYDRGLATPTLTTAPDLSFTLLGYDGLGRVQSVTKNATDAPSMLGTHPSTVNTYADFDPKARRPGYLSTQRWDGTAYRTSVTYVDGMGTSIVSLKQAAASDAPYTWIVSGVKQYGARGHVTDDYDNVFSTTAPISFPFTQATVGAARHTVYDAFGRPILTRNLTNQQDTETHYHALSTDSYDALHLPNTGRGASATTTIKDGHGRITQSVVHGHIGSSTALTTITTKYVYTVTGQAVSIARTDGATMVTHNMKYDSLDQLVENREPNTTSGTNDWRYIYDDFGHVVATSDPRGCGENIAYDAAGRKLTEDFSPCDFNQPEYTIPASDGSSGYEVVYGYDAPQGQSATAPDGHLHTVADRASLTFYTYDARGRTSRVDRGLARPDATSSVALSNYAANTFTYNLLYDDGDRVIWRSTGANAPDLLPGGQSILKPHYDERGHIKSLDGSYGLLVAKTQFNADGLPVFYQYGDAASTGTTYSYNGLGQLDYVVTRRSGGWPAVDAASSPATEEQMLQQLSIAYDAVGNPNSIADTSDEAKDWPTVWPAGARPIHHKTIQYDDLYHVTKVALDTANDSFTDPFAAEFAAENAHTAVASSPVPAVVPPSPKRIQWQSFDYDWQGNIKTSDDDQHLFYDRSLGTITPSTTHPNQIATAAGTGGSVTPTYDAGGNVISLVAQRSGICALAGKCAGTKFVYYWDELGRLSRAQRWDFIPQPGHPGGPAAVDATYSYDANGLRVLKRISLAGASPTYGAEVFPTLRLEGASWNATTAKYQDDETTEGVYLVAGSGPIARLAYASSDPHTQTSGALHVFFEIKDSLGSSSFVVDRDTSELVERTTYQPYGGIETDFRTPRWENFREPYKFTGKEDDIGLGVTYFGGRYYAPALGVFASADPVAVHDKKGDLNPYSYVSGRLFRATDPTGLTIEFGNNDYGDYGQTPMGGGTNSNDPLQQFSQMDQMNQWAEYAVNMMYGAYGVANGLSGGAADLTMYLTLGYVPSPTNALGRVMNIAGNVVGAVGMTAITSGMSAVGQGAEALDIGASAKTAGTELLAARAATEAPLMSPAAVPPVPDLGEVAIGMMPTGACFIGGTSVATPWGPRAIESLRVGDRVDTIGDDDRTGETAVDPRTWRDVLVRMPNPDGSDDQLDIELLRPDAWLDATGAAPNTWIDFSLPEMGLRGPAEVIEAAPVTHVQDGPGRVVLATVTHLNGEVLSLALPGKGTIEPTATHWLYSADRSAWVRARDLYLGEHLATADGIIAIEAIERHRQIERVYNIEVETQHSYLVGASRVLSHNVNPCGAAAGAAAGVVEGAEAVGAYERSALVSASYKTNGAAEVAAGATCQYCQAGAATTIDHVISARAAHDVAAMGIMPKTNIRIGLAGADNLLGACGTCNFGKGAMLPGNVPGTWLPPNPSSRAIDLMQQMGTWVTP